MAAPAFTLKIEKIALVTHQYLVGKCVHEDLRAQAPECPLPPHPKRPPPAPSSRITLSVPLLIGCQKCAELTD